MDAERFDRLVESLTRPGSRRGALQTLGGAFLGAVGLGALAGEDAAGKNARRDKGRKRNHQKNRKTRSQALPANCCSSGNCTPGEGKSLTKCCYENANLAGANFRRSNLGGANFRGANLANADFSNANLSKACLVDADISGAKFANANLSGVVYCRTKTGPNTYKNDGCNKSTSCCQTCVPLGETRCGLGGSCCGGGVCENNTCVCATGQTNCNGACRNLQSDADHCGACGDACPVGETCQGGQCQCGSNPTCASGLTCCSGQCVNLLTDVNNCTECGNVCPGPLSNAGVTCGAGVDENNQPAYGCVMTCATGWDDCNNDYEDGCETDISSNNFYCGTCGATDCAATGKVCKNCKCRLPEEPSVSCGPVTLGKVIRKR